MTESIDVKCPKCGAAIPLTEAIARPLLDAERKKLEKETQERATTLEKRESEIETRRQALAEAEKNLKRQKIEIDHVVDERLKAEREALIREVETKTSGSYTAIIQDKDKALADSEAKRTKAEKAELEARQQQQALADEKRTLDLTVSRRVAEETKKIRAEVTQERDKVFQAELIEKDRALAEKDAKLLEAQKAELDIRKERQTLEDEKNALELQVQRRVDEERQKVRESTQREEQENYRLKLADKDKAIEDTKRKLDEAQRKIEQGSQQLQGEVAEIDLEDLLRTAFQRDHFESVAPGKPGADLVHTVISGSGAECGKILWERKRTKSWSKDWLAKNRSDQRAIGAHMGVIVTLTMPEDLDTFDHREGVWVVSSVCSVPLAKALRQTLIEAANARTAEQDRDGKKEVMYAYVTGQKFRQRVQGLVEAYISMRKDLEAEKRALTRLWAKRESEIELLIVGAAGMYGDFQGIVGKSLPEIEQLKLPGAPEGSRLELPDGENPGKKKNAWEF